MTCFTPGTVVVYEHGAPSAPGQPPRRVIATVTAGPWQDGTYDLDVKQQARPEALWRLSAGDCLEYLSVSLGQWIPARVLRPGRVPGTLDLDIKEGASTSRLRPLGAGAAVPAGPPPGSTLLSAALPPPPGAGGAQSPALPPPPPPLALSTGPVGALALTARGAPPPGQLPVRAGRASGWGPLGLRAGEHCFYRSSGHGWIPARVQGWRAEDQTYDLDVKRMVHPDLIRSVREGDAVEYQSTSTHMWIPARVVQLGREPGSYDLDIKPGVSLRRLRPPEAPAAASQPAAGLSPACSSTSSGSPPARSPGASPSPRPVPSGVLDCPAGPPGLAWPAPPPSRTPSGSGGPGRPPSHQLAAALPGRAPPSWGPCLPVGSGGLPAGSGSLPGGSGSLPVGSGSPLGGSGCLPAGSGSLPAGGGCLPVGSGSLPGPAEPWPWPPGAAPASGAGPASAPSSRASEGEGSACYGPGEACQQQSYRICPAKGNPDITPEGDFAVPTEKKLEQLREAIHAQDAVALRQRMESQSVVMLQGEELDHASHVLWALEARPAALKELRNAAGGSNPVALEAAIEAAAAAGAADSDLEAASLALQGMRSMAWVYAPEDGKHIDIRAEPKIGGPRTKHVLQPGDIFRTSVEARGSDGVMYLKLADGRGWVFQRKPAVGVLCYRHQEDSPGTYAVTHDGTAVTPTVAIGRDEDVIDRIAFGERVSVAEIVYSEERIRGRILRPSGWISLMNMETGKRWAQKCER